MIGAIVTSLDLRGARVAALFAGGAHLAVAIAAVLARIEGTSEWYDQRDYHAKVIARFAAELPSPVLSDYASATTPGYHLLMAILAAAGAGDFGMHLANAAFGAALVALLAFAVARFSGFAVGLGAGLALGLSPYVLSSSVWLTTDNLGTLLVLAAAVPALGIATGLARASAREAAFSAAFAASASAVRQVLAFAAALPLAAVVARAAGLGRWPRVRDLAVASLALVPSMVLVGAFVALWGGLVPPSFADYHGAGGNAATPVYALALIGVWGVGSFTAIPGFVRALVAPRALLVGALAGIVACTIPTDYVVHVRFGGILWTAASLVPAPFERSLLLVPLSALGAAALAAYLALWRRTGDPAARGGGALALLAWTGLVAAQTANQQCFERYLQPATLVFAAIAAAAVGGRTLRAWPFVLMAAVSLGLSAVNVFRVAAAQPPTLP